MRRTELLMDNADLAKLVDREIKNRRKKEIKRMSDYDLERFSQHLSMPPVFHLFQAVKEWVLPMLGYHCHKAEDDTCCCFDCCKLEDAPTWSKRQPVWCSAMSADAYEGTPLTDSRYYCDSECSTCQQDCSYAGTDSLLS